MGTRVEIINNPYIQRFRILINGEAVSVYSNLEKYIDEPFCYWCDRILDSIYEECNGGDFSLHFCSRKEELEVMEKLAQSYTHCTQYSSSPLIRPTSLLERIKNLNNIVRGVRSSGHHIFIKDVLFVLPESLKRLEADLSGLEVKNSFCQINSRVVYYHNYSKKSCDADTLFLISDDLDIKKHIQRMEIRNGFGIELGTEKIFKEKIDDLFVYESPEESIFEIIFECLLLSPLLEIFCSCISTLSPEIKERYSEKLEELQSIDLKLIPVPEKTTIEVGKSSRIQFKTDIDGYKVKSSQLHYSYSEKGIIHCNGLLVEGLKAGRATLNIFREGEQIPCASVDYSVIQRNRIKELRIEEECLTIGEGDCVRLNVIYLPTNADNVSSIEWKSDNEKIAKVDSSGCVRGVSKGSCIIRCFAEQVSARCQCVVKPHLKTILTDTKEIELIYGQEKEIKINLKPENCVDDQISFCSMDMQIVNVVGRTLKAIGIGTTRVIIQNKQETVRTEIVVHVMTEKEYRKLQKEREKGVSSIQEKEKKGLLSRLFG